MLEVFKISSGELFALLTAVSFAAGLNLYATIAVLGLLARLGHLPLPPGLLVLQSWPVIAASAVLFLIEFFADKIPAFDLIWNALHTFIRVPAAGLIAFRAAAQLSPGHQLLAMLLGAGVALVAHSGKTAARVAISPSPEPFSNSTLSLSEDAVAIGLTWLAASHPYLAGTLAISLIVMFSLLIVLTIRLIIRGLRTFGRQCRASIGWIASRFAMISS